MALSILTNSLLLRKLLKALGRFSSAFHYSFFAEKGATLNSFELQDLSEMETLGLLRGRLRIG